jgi:hypothetical protein
VRERDVGPVGRRRQHRRCGSAAAATAAAVTVSNDGQQTHADVVGSTRRAMAPRRVQRPAGRRRQRRGLPHAYVGADATATAQELDEKLQTTAAAAETRSCNVTLHCDRIQPRHTMRGRTLSSTPER